jgi:hypothetical protein
MKQLYRMQQSTGDVWIIWILNNNICRRSSTAPASDGFLQGFQCGSMAVASTSASMAKAEIRDRRAAALAGERTPPDPDGHHVINRQRYTTPWKLNAGDVPCFFVRLRHEFPGERRRLPGHSCRCRVMNRSMHLLSQSGAARKSRNTTILCFGEQQRSSNSFLSGFWKPIYFFPQKKKTNLFNSIKK